ncbi:amidohydrolase [Pseudoalteromonas sp. C2R02]|uniref:amidohydrolase n=1 Tax=Pseudoalteromonas sp. C2R02 TaxID=2841565 RepID=UPI001C099B7C|nr:amidohydrolase [Pseudoalteromonas sp. C2R02]MBU2970825.1 amidohydrolase [Pseudoalteromonas sp. C2R02]
MKNFITLKVKMIIWITLSTLIAAGCSSSESKKEDNNMGIVATKIFRNAAIYTVNEQHEWAQAIAIKDNEIIFVGSDKEVENYIGPETIITDLKGKMMMPGFHDVHIHPIESGSQNTQFSLDTDELNAENFIDTIAQASYQNPNSKWLIGYGHSIFALFESSISPLEIINEAVPDRPVIIMEQTSHSMWVNSAALELANIDSNTPNPIGGIIVKDEITGEPNGVLIDNAGNLLMDLAMTPTAQSMQADYNGLVQYTLPELAKNGITSISDARSFWKRDDHLTWQKVQKNNELTARVAVGLWAYPELDDNTQLESLISLYSNQADSFLRFNQIKLYSDGILINTTAAMFDEYEIKLLDTKTNNGVNYFTQSRVEKYIKALEPKGFDFHIHAIGDRGIHESLNAIENAASSQGRHRITHVEIVDPADYTRFALLNVTADAQVAGEFTNPEHWHENEELIGVVRSDNAVPIKSLNDAGARITLSSDWSVSPFNPFLGLQNAVTRYPQALTLKQAIKAYTINGAYVMRQENTVGTIEVGKLADLVILDRNIFDIDPNTINQTKVVMTVLDGEVIYQDQRK